MSSSGRGQTASAGPAYRSRCGEFLQPPAAPDGVLGFVGGKISCAGATRQRIAGFRQKISICRNPCREKLPNPGTFAGEISKPWKFYGKNFQTLEILPEKLPNLGNFARKTSKPWRFCKENFQTLEVLREKLPNLGTFARTNFQTPEVLWKKLPSLGTFAKKTSKPWKFWERSLRSLEVPQKRFSASCGGSGRTGGFATGPAGAAGFAGGRRGRDSALAAEKCDVGAGEAGKRRGAALVVALWVLFIMSLLVAGLAFNMQVEGAISSQFRKRLQAEYLARGGVELARYILVHLNEVGQEEEFPGSDNDDLLMAALHLKRGMGVSEVVREVGGGKMTLSILPEEARRNVNQLTDEDWEEILDQGNVPQERWAELIDCFRDWVDQNEEHRLNGAESDDPFYQERGYKCKNAPLDTVDELLLIKGFTPQIVYGGPAEEEDQPPYIGIARWLTVWGDGRVNVNSASREVLLTLPEIDEMAVDAIMEGRLGPDGEPGTRDDGFRSVEEVIAAAGLPQDAAKRLTVSSRKYLRVVSTGEVGDLAVVIWCVLEGEGDNVKVVFWREDTASKT